MFNLPKLPYSHDALEPHIDAQTMEIHHERHHAAYVDKLNAAIQNAPEWADKPIEELLQNLDALPAEIRTAVQNNGGGHANHSLFWTILAPNAGGQPDGEIGRAINTGFGDFKAFRSQFADAAMGRFGSGWAWLCVGSDGKLEVTTTPNQDTPLMVGKTPILGIDVWEHAYYLNYQNRRKDYIGAFWNIVNWEQVEEYYQVARSVTA